MHRPQFPSVVCQTDRLAAFACKVQLPRGGKHINLNSIKFHDKPIYIQVFEYLRKLWQSEVNLVSKTSYWRTGEPFVATKVRSFSHVIINGTRFGACTSHRGKGTSFAFIDGRVAVRIQYLLFVKHDRRDPTKAPLSTTFAVVERFKDHNVPEMPWSSQ